MLGWHFLADGPEGPVLRDKSLAPPVGQWLEYDGPVVPCNSGLHCSEHPMDALQWAPGPILCRVELEGDLQAHGSPVDKWAGRRRLILWQVDATEALRAFARSQALSVIHLWDCPDVMRQYLETGDVSLREQAQAAAWAAQAAQAAAWAAAQAAQAAAWDAARAAAWAAAAQAAAQATQAAAWDAARAAAWAATTWAATQQKQRDEFLALCESLKKD